MAFDDHYKKLFGSVAESIPSPCFVLDESLLIRNLELMRSVRERAGIELICALKGFSMYPAFPLVAQYLSGGSASSLNEARLIFEEMGVKAHTYCPVYIASELEELLGYSQAVTFNSLSELDRYGAMARDRGISVGIRVNPGYSEISTALYNPADPASRLGIPSEKLEDGLPEGVEGLHFHVLCENDSHTLERVLKVFTEKFGHLFPACKWINFGGGHLMTRRGYDTEHLIALLRDFRETHDVEIILEPGSAIAWETGYLTSTVLDIVENGDRRTAMLDVSFTCHMPDCLEMPYKPAVMGSTADGGHTYALGGMSCLAGDFIDGFQLIEPLQIGDRLVFMDMIHYTMVKTTTFNGVGLPAIATLHTDGQLEVHRTFGYADYKQKLG